MIFPLTAAVAVAMAVPPAAADVTARPLPAPDPAVVSQVLGRAAAQVKRCYRSPKLARDARQISTHLIVRFAPDGTLTGLPELAGQSGVTPGNQPFAAQMAEAAMLAIIRCAPLSLPADQYESIWKEFELTFSPGGSA